MKKRILLLSRIKTPDGTILCSKYRHHYVSYVDKNGETYFLDGGRDYMKTSLNKEPATCVSLYSNSPFEELRKYVEIQSYNSKGIIYKPIGRLSANQLRAALICYKIQKESFKHDEIYEYVNEIYKLLLKEKERRDNKIKNNKS